MYVLGIIDTINEWSENIKDWFIVHGNNPWLWFGLFGLGMVVFFLTMGALNKGD